MVMGPDLRGYTRAEIENALLSLGEKPGNAGAVFMAVHRRGAADLMQLANVPERVRKALAGAFTLPPLPLPESKLTAADGTRKLLFRFDDGAMAECVVLPGKDQQAACISSQSGCACGCTFCSTGALGLKRSLTPAEIVAQFEACRREAVDLRGLVFMGMGEPFLNWANVQKAIRILSDSRGRHFQQVKMTVSTVGVIPVIEELITSDLRVRLAVSVIAADPDLRARLAPMEKVYPLKKVLAAVRRYCEARRALVMFEYILLPGVNDRPSDSAELAELIKGIPCRVNLIPYNPPDGPGRENPRVKEFQLELMAAGSRAYIRQEKGAGIAAACGQLAGGRS